VCTVVYTASSKFKKLVGSLALFVFVLTFLAALDGLFKPYSVSDPAFPRPKRLYLVVSGRTRGTHTRMWSLGILGYFFYTLVIDQYSGLDIDCQS